MFIHVVCVVVVVFFVLVFLSLFITSSKGKVMIGYMLLRWLQ